MVVLGEVNNMFWGVTLDGGKRYSQTVERSFHISMAALDPSSITKESNKVSVMIQHEKAEFMLCTLHSGVYQQPMDLNFTEGEEVTFFLNGNGVVHLTGYLTPEVDYEDEMDELGEEDSGEEFASEDEEDDDDDDDDEEEEEDEAPQLLAFESKAGKRKKGQQEATVKKMKFDESVEFDSDEDDDDYSEGDEEEEEEGEDELDDEEDDEDDDDEEEDEEDEDDDEEEEDESDEEGDANGSFVQKGKDNAESKSSKDSANTNIKALPKTKVKSEPTTPVANGTSSAKKKDKSPVKSETKKNEGSAVKTPKDSSAVKTPKDSSAKKTPKDGSAKKTPKEGSAKKAQNEGSAKKTPKRVVAGGVILEDLKDGHGPAAKPGKTLHLYYKGTLTNGKQFDSVSNGRPFKIKLGKGEVIKGWDVGLQGMKVGGKRKLTIPPSYAYGSSRIGSIPPNSTLVFEVELKAVS